ncbi:caspase family protein [Candidatus Uabimicrobium amorphum]|uniref:Peptidase C14 caspase domain-containing protein n=1 Tax=Uabimicrobium amorphum TaxID=2596890 RepID=A0A5S9IRR2_UABAM|nr:caspase family protein [Candidatus Uabimicrobium amorphum]BBM86242.1 hypothetical protein UABAM_04628 [Candidatus Uabimicrobium amorphum]
MKSLLLALLLITCLMSQENKYALLIGINQYNDNRIRDLKGCVNDIRAVKNLLTNNFGFSQNAHDGVRENIITLLDGEARALGIKMALDSEDSQLKKYIESTPDEDEKAYIESIESKIGNMGILQRVKENDGGVVVIYFSGHGAQVTDKNGDESDGKDEILVTANTKLGPNASGNYRILDEDNTSHNYIVDDYIHEILNKLIAAKARVTVIFDCCHSGTATRDLEEQSKQLRVAVEAAIERGEDRPAPAGSIFISACQSQQVTTEHEFDNGEKAGLLTYNLLQAISALGKKHKEITYKQVFNHIRTKYRSSRVVKSIPTIEGDMTRNLFESTCSGVGKAKVIQTQEMGSMRKVTLDRGSFSGVTPGSIFALENKSLCYISQVQPLTCTGEILEVNDKRLSIYQDLLQKYIDAIPKEEITWPSNKELHNNQNLLSAQEIVHPRNWHLNLYITQQPLKPKKNDRTSKTFFEREQTKSLHFPLEELGKAQDYKALYDAIVEYQKKGIVKIVDKRALSQVILQLNKNVAQVYWNEGYYTDYANRIRFPAFSKKDAKTSTESAETLAKNPAEILKEILQRFGKIRNLLKIPSSDENLIDVELTTPKKPRQYLPQLHSGNWRIGSHIQHLQVIPTHVVYATHKSVFAQNTQNHFVRFPTKRRKVLALKSIPDTSIVVYLTDKSLYVVDVNSKKVIQNTRIRGAQKNGLAVTDRFLAIVHKKSPAYVISVWEKTKDAYKFVTEIPSKSVITSVAIHDAKNMLAFIKTTIRVKKNNEVKRKSKISFWDLHHKKNIGDTEKFKSKANSRIFFSETHLYYDTQDKIHRIPLAENIVKQGHKHFKRIRKGDDEEELFVSSFHKNYAIAIQNSQIRVYNLDHQKQEPQTETLRRDAVEKDLGNVSVQVVTGKNPKIVIAHDGRIYFRALTITSNIQEEEKKDLEKQHAIPQFYESDQFSIRITNNSSENLDVYAIFIGTDYSIQSKKAQDIAAHKQTKIDITCNVEGEELFSTEGDFSTLAKIDEKTVANIRKKLQVYYPVSEQSSLSFQKQDYETWHFTYMDTENTKRYGILHVSNQEMKVSIKKFGMEHVKLVALSGSTDFKLFDSSLNAQGLKSQKVRLRSLEQQPQWGTFDFSFEVIPDESSEE